MGVGEERERREGNDVREIFGERETERKRRKDAEGESESEDEEERRGIRSKKKEKEREREMSLLQSFFLSDRERRREEERERRREEENENLRLLLFANFFGPKKGGRECVWKYADDVAVAVKEEVRGKIRETEMGREKEEERGKMEECEREMIWSRKREEREERIEERREERREETEERREGRDERKGEGKREERWVEGEGEMERMRVLQNEFFLLRERKAELLTCAWEYAFLLESSLLPPLLSLLSSVEKGIAHWKAREMSADRSSLQSAFSHTRLLIHMSTRTQHSWMFFKHIHTHTHAHMYTRAVRTHPLAGLVHRYWYLHESSPLYFASLSSHYITRHGEREREKEEREQEKGREREREKVKGKEEEESKMKPTSAPSPSSLALSPSWHLSLPPPSPSQIVAGNLRVLRKMRKFILRYLGSSQIYVSKFRNIPHLPDAMDGLIFLFAKQIQNFQELARSVSQIFSSDSGQSIEVPARFDLSTFLEVPEASRKIEILCEKVIWHAEHLPILVEKMREVSVRHGVPSIGTRYWSKV